MNVQRDEHAFALGQPLWLNAEFQHLHGSDRRTYVAIGFSKGFLATWFVELVWEKDLTGPSYQLPVHFMTDQPTAEQQLHSSHEGKIFTVNGRPVKLISGGKL